MGQKKPFANTDEKCKNTQDEKEASKPPLEPVSFLQLYRFSTTGERAMLLFAIFATFVGSGVIPISNIVFGRTMKLMVQREMGGNECNGTANMIPGSLTATSTSPSTESVNKDIYEEMIRFSVYMIGLGVIQSIAGYLFISVFNRAAENLVFRLRQIFLESLLRQDVGWYDTVDDKNFVSKVSEDIESVQEAVGEKVGLCVFYILSSVISLVLSFYFGWKLTLVVLSSAPIIVVASTVVSSFQSRMGVKEQEAYTKSGGIAQEVLVNIKTVMAFSGQRKEMERYKKGLVLAISAGKLRGFISAIGNGILWLLNYMSFALAFWYGTKLILDGERTVCEKEPEYTAETLFIVFFGILYGSFNIGQAMSYLEVFTIGRVAATSIYKIIDRVPEIDSYANIGIKPKSKLTGKIEFLNVRFSYPSRQEVKVLQGLSIKIQPGSTIALVGNSGCGKSTCMQLLQRFYDPESGTVMVDGNDIKDYNINWYRSQLGVVNQEPILFNTTIAENVRYGKDGASQKEIEEACRLANAHDFISKLPHKYDTNVGDRGAQLSGGQKQRIAIARALVRNPSILLLDEATSALDTHSEAIVQQALDKARMGRTTLIVAHRLSTIRSADVIVSVQNGQVVEVGTHEELISQKGLYFQLATAQTGVDPSEEGDDYCNQLEADAAASDASRQIKYIPPEDDIPGLSGVIAHTDEDEDIAKATSFLSIMKLNAKEWPLITTGVIMSILHGCVLPVYAYYFGEFTEVLAFQDLEEAQRKANYYCIIFVIIGFFAGFTIFASMACFGAAGTILTNRLRKRSFKTMLQQELAWYDDSANGVGALCSRLSGDAASVEGATGGRLGVVVQSITTIVVAACLCLYINTRLGAAALAFVPPILISIHYNGKILERNELKDKNAIEEASKLAFQAASNIRTVASLCKEKAFVKMYCEALKNSHVKAVAYSHLIGFLWGFSHSVGFMGYGTVLYYGSILIRDENLHYKVIFLVAEALVWSMFLLGNTLAFAPNYHKAKVAGGRILKLLNTKPSIVNSPGVGLQIRNCQGSLIFDKTEFYYPTRPEVKILKGLTLGIEPNSNIGICGPSGSGKSTCIQLILRYYDPTSGRVLLDETDVAALNVDALRSQMAIVSQEPALFDRTMAENIAYGDNSRAVDMLEIIEAARTANIHDFISSLPAGYSTRVGDMGAQISGGQKQRVAIARALIRNPKLLLLDEATSALDSASEKIVQAALDIASTGRTCITIAHRLSSIQNSDRILVICGGNLSESGTHAELLQKRGIYSKLWNTQRRGVS